jgi:hypothetical protein
MATRCIFSFSSTFCDLHRPGNLHWGCSTGPQLLALGTWKSLDHCSMMELHHASCVKRDGFNQPMGEKEGNLVQSTPGAQACLYGLHLLQTDQTLEGDLAPTSPAGVSAPNPLHDATQSRCPNLHTPCGPCPHLASSALCYAVDWAGSRCAQASPL